MKLKILTLTLNLQIKKKHLVQKHAADIHLDGVGEDGNWEQELVVEEDDAEQLLSTETSDDLDEVDSDDDFGFLFFGSC